MKIVIMIMVLILLCFVSPSMVFAQENNVSASDELQNNSEAVDNDQLSTAETPVISTQTLFDVWFNRLNLLKGSNFVQNRVKRAEEEFKRFNETRLDRGIRRPKLYSSALTREGFQFIMENDPISAIDSFNKAIQIDPSNSTAYYGRGKAYLTKSKLSFISYFIEILKGYFAGFNDFWIKFFRIGSLYFTSLFGILLWLVSLIFIVFIKYEALLRHDVSEIIPISLNKIVIFIITWTILLLPIFLGKGFLVMLLFWYVLLWVYLQKTEKIMTGVLIVMMFAVPMLLKNSVSFYKMYNNRSVHSIILGYYGGWNVKANQYLMQWNEEHPSDMEPYFLSGLMYRKKGDFFQAIKEYEKALKIDTTNSAAYNNIGNIYYFLGDYKQAISNYKKSLSYCMEDKNSAAIHYNLNKAFLAEFDFKNAESELSQASMADRNLIINAQNNYAPTPNRKLIDKYLPIDSVWNFFDQDDEKTDLEVQELWSLFVVGLPINQLSSVTIVVIILIVILSFARDKFGFAHYCLMCGTPTCKRCQRHLASEKYCSHCMQLFIKKDGVDPEMRNQKMLQVHRHKKREIIIGRLLSLIYPGAGHFYIDEPVYGGVITFLWIMVLARLFYSGKFFSYPLSVFNQTTSLFSIFWVIILVIIYLFANIHLSKVTEQAE